MQITMITILCSAAALLVGGAVGYSFGLIQDSARRRNEKLQERGELTNGWAVMPGSGKRVATLVIVLALIQVLCPMLFANGTQWWVSGGVVGGYGTVLYSHLRQKLYSKK